MKGLDFQIGDKVIWTVGKIVCSGYYLDDNLDNTSNIMPHKIDGVVNNQIIPVIKKILKLDI